LPGKGIYCKTGHESTLNRELLYPPVTHLLGVSSTSGRTSSHTLLRRHFLDGIAGRRRLVNRDSGVYSSN
jgi:hypothetical protein